MIRDLNPFRRAPRYDIVVTFNEVDYGRKREYAPRTLGGRPIGFVDQLCVLGASVQVHAPRVRRYAVHTQPLTAAQRTRLEANGWQVVHRERQDDPPELERFHDRLAGYTVGRAQAQLYLDSDMILTAPLTLDVSAPVAVTYAGNHAFDAETWNRLCALSGARPVEAEDLSAYTYDDWFLRGRPSDMPFFNNGAVLVRRDRREDFVALMTEIGERIRGTELLETVPRLGHFFDQVCMSLAVRRTAGADLLPPGVNTLRSMVDLTDPEVRARVALLHYLGSKDVADVHRHFPEPFDAVLGD